MKLDSLDLTSKLAVDNNHQYDSALSNLRQLQNKTHLSEKDVAQLKEAAQDFEAIFLTMILKNMRKSMPQSNLFGNGPGADIYSGMFDENIAKTVASKGGIHLSDTIIESLTGNHHSGMTGRALSDYQNRRIRELDTEQITDDWDRSLIQEAAKKFNLDPKLIEAVIKTESNYKSQAVSSKGAVGLMQLMKATAADVGVSNRYDPRQNVFGGARYLRRMLDRFNGDPELALGAYNAGPAAVEKYNGLPPYKETKNYVDKVLKTYEEL